MSLTPCNFILSEGGRVLSFDEARQYLLDNPGVWKNIKKPIDSKTGIQVFHGSPHTFGQFDIAKLGSGEGNQAFGYGLYFTNEKSIAEGYANALSSRKNFWDALRNGSQISLSKQDFDFIKNELDALGFDGQTAMQDDLEMVLVDGKEISAPDVLDALSVLFGKNAKKELAGYDLTEEQINRLMDIRDKIAQPRLYSVSLHKGKSADQFDYMEWSEPLTDAQRTKIGESLPDDITGKQAYKILSEKMGGDKAASEFLLSKGIDGITYKAKGETGGPTGQQRNYVVFDPGAITIEDLKARGKSTIDSLIDQADRLIEENKRKRGGAGSALQSVVSPGAAYDALLSAYRAVLLAAKAAGKVLTRAQAMLEARKQVEGKFDAKDIQDAEAALNERLSGQAPKAPEAKPEAPKPAAESGEKKKTLFERASRGEAGKDASLMEKLDEIGRTRLSKPFAEVIREVKAATKGVSDEKVLEMARDKTVEQEVRVALYGELLERNKNTPFTEETQQEIAERQALYMNEFSALQTASGRAGAISQLIYENLEGYFNFSKQLVEFLGKNTGLDEGEVKRLKDLVARLEKANAELKEKQEANEKARIKEEEESAVERISDGMKREKPVTKSVLKEKAKELRKKQFSRPGYFSAATPATLAFDAAVEGMALALEAGGEVEIAIKKGIEALKKTDWYKGHNNKDKAEKEFEKWALGELLPKAEVGEDGKVKVPSALIRYYVGKGEKDIDVIAGEIKEDLAKEGHELSIREIRDAITGYAREINPRKNELEEQINTLKRIGRKLSNLEDIRRNIQKAKNPKLKKELSDREKILDEQIRQEMANLGPTAEQRKLAALQKRLDDILMGVVEIKEDKPEDSPEVKALKEQILKAKQLMGLTPAKRSPEEIKVDAAISATERAISELNEKIKKGLLQKAGKPNPILDERLDALRETLKAKREEYKKLREEAGVFEKDRLEAFKVRQREALKDLERRLREGDFDKKPRRAAVELDEEARRLANERYVLQEEFDRELEKAFRNTDEGRVDTAIQLLLSSLSIKRAFQTGVDLGVVFVQGAMLPFYGKGMFSKGIRGAVSSAKSEEAFLAIAREMKSNPLYYLIKKSGLDLALPHAKSTATEEFLQNRAMEAMWDVIAEGVGAASPKTGKFLKKANPIAFFNRTQLGYLNTMKMAIFLDGAQKLIDQGITYENTPQAYKDLADMINTLSGRTSLKGAESSKFVMAGLNALFYSARNLASVLKMGIPFITLYHVGRRRAGAMPGQMSVAQGVYTKIFLRSMASTIGTVLLLKALREAIGDDEEEQKTGERKWDVSTDPKSSLFMKIRVGNQTIDPFHGFQQTSVLQSRYALAAFDQEAYTNTRTGIPYKLGEKPAPTKAELGWRFISGKFSPQASFAKDWITGEPVKGTPYYKSPNGEYFTLSGKLVEDMAPLSFGAVEETFEEQQNPILIGLFSALAVAGAGLNTMKPNDKTAGAMRERLGVEPDEKKTFREAFLSRAKTGEDPVKAREYFDKSKPEDKDIAQYTLQIFKDNTSEDVLDSKYKITTTRGKTLLAKMVFEGYKPTSSDYFMLSPKDEPALKKFAESGTAQDMEILRAEIKTQVAEWDNLARTLGAYRGEPEKYIERLENKPLFQAYKEVTK